jgi:hypothetical protein
MDILTGGVCGYSGVFSSSTFFSRSLEEFLGSSGSSGKLEGSVFSKLHSSSYEGTMEDL